ncbi:nitrate- and nitrite sensing domain-containing protein [Streptomyces sp. NBC_00572]|uniref:sensor histidine kinase n=1 Tax=Streptomyces sp. NBC_00572 TaxID=2903664 RepID=UPI00224F5FAB|nr:nitrate- and nitrite sensing domain-containing protein [Streptomyces sp. NBC_00572]MCX4985568.1 nitrate- and nitrite sensing domain-containing protein [Streptomyces sp. NBC_00572]
MRTPRRTNDAEASAPPSAAARGRRAHAGPPADEPGEPTPEAFPTTARMAATHAPSAPPAAEAGPLRPPRGGLRPRTVRAKIVSLLMVPVVSLLALWGFATVTTAQDVARLRQLQRVDAEIREPVTAAVAALQAERRAAVRQIAAPGATRAAELKDRIRRTDEAVDRLRLNDTHTVGDAGDLPGDVGERVTVFVGKVAGLARLRTAAADGRADGNQVYEEYTAAVSAAFAVGGALTGIQDTRQGSDARVLLEFGRAGEMLSREDALLAAAHLDGRFTADRLRAFAGAVETRRTLTASATADLPAAERAAWARLAAGTDHTRLTRAEDRILSAEPGRPAAQAVTSADWDDTLAAVRSGLTAIETDARTAAAHRADPFAGGVLTAGGAAVVLGLAAVAASLVISVRIGRGLVVELVSLRNTALGIARGKLPAAMRRLRAGEEIDVQAEAPPGPVSQDEIGQVGEALTTVHRAALSAAVERAELASGISGVFVNLARRSQVLVHRQLNLLDSMERRADDPNELGDLFRLDHLTTRMRRHAESLIILSGAAPGRAWRMPVPLTNVVRAAVSEIEDYARVEVRRLPETAVVGGAVADLTHLLAELIENAAQFSPPHTKVRVSGEPVGNGYALEIEDRGLGMGKDTLADANARIAQSEALDLFDSDRLGLFVVSRLSSRHDIKVQLRTSPYGGTTAVVLLPTDLLQGALPPGRGTPATGDGPDTPHAGTPQVRDPRIPAAGGGEPGADHRQSRDEHATGDRFGPDGFSADRLGADRRTDDGRAAREREEAHRAEARRFGRPQVSRAPAQAGPPAPAISGGAPAGPVPAPRRTAPQPPTGARPGALPKEVGGARPPLPPQAAPSSRPQPLPRPTAVPALAPSPQSGPPPAGVTELRRRGPSVPPTAREQQPGTPAGHAGHAGPAGRGGALEGELPRRVRQASLVPQLREAPAAAPVFVPAAPETDARTPEVVRDRMTAYRDGWQRGGGAAPGSRRPLGTGTGQAPGHGTTPLDDPRPEGDQA